MIPFLPLAGSVVDTIGRTPMVELHKLRARLKLEGRLLAKLEYFNPGFSKKDRIALEMIRGARTRGDLRPGQTVVELTSGNTGTGLAIVCRALGHPLVAVMSKGNTIERARMMAALGAQVVRVDQAPGSQPHQVSGADLAIQGGGHSMADLPLLDRGLVTDYLKVTDSAAMEAARLLAQEEGIFGGFSAGANFAGVVQVLQAGEHGAVAFLICDSGLKYLSTDLYP